MRNKTNDIRWYQLEIEIKNDPVVYIPIRPDDIEAVRKSAKEPIPEDRLKIMAQSRKASKHPRELMAALTKSCFTAMANKFLTMPIENSLASRDILLNVLTLLDRRVGKKRIMNMSDSVRLKHSIVQYFYELRCSS